MPKTIVKIQTIRANTLAADHIIWAGTALLRKWGIAPNQSVNLRFGAFRSHVTVLPSKKAGLVRISEGLAASMGLSGVQTLRAAYRPSTQTLSVGPLIGVLMSRASSKQPDRPFGSTTAFCRELTDAAKQQGAFVYFFPPSASEANQSTIKGWTYSGNGWKQGVFPIPDVLHNRLTSRKLENLESVQTLFSGAKSRHGTHVFNEKYLDKTEVFAALKQEESVKRYLPESHPCNGFDTIKSMGSKYRTFFLKPIRGSLGQGIIRVTKTENGGYACHFSEASGTRTAVYPSLAKVYAVVAPRIKRNRHQIQQGLQLAAVDGRPIDFRALVQKGLSGEWGVTSIVGRIAGPNQFVSNLAKGGTISSMKSAVARSNIPPGRRGIVMNQLNRAALHIAKGIESAIDAHFGELGIDLAVDRSGRVWLLEVNSKPSKNDNTQLNEGKMRPSTKMLVQYARHLSRL